MRATGSTSHDSDACVIHGNWVFGNMGLQSGVMVSSRRISRACSRAKYQGKRRRLQALRPVHHNLSWGQASARRRSLIGPRAKRISYFRENVAMLPRETICSQFFFFFARGCGQSGALTVEAFVLSGLHALRPMPHNLSWGLASGRRRWSMCPRARRISSFCEDFARLPRRTKCSHSCCQKS